MESIIIDVKSLDIWIKKVNGSVVIVKSSDLLLEEKHLIEKVIKLSDKLKDIDDD